MSSKDLFNVKVTSRYSKKSDLVTYLTQLHKHLNGLSQEPHDRPKGLSETALQLISSKILGNADKDIRLLACCCIVDILRVFAPDAPYSNEDTVKVFEVIVAQLHGLSTYDKTSSAGIQKLYILSSLASVKSCVMPVVFASDNVAGAEEVVVSMFEAILSSMRVDQPTEVVQHFGEILVALLEEFEEVPPEILEIILHPLLPTSRAESPATYKLIGQSLRRASTTIVGSVSAYLTNCLANHSAEEHASDLAAEIYALIYEVHLISPSFLVRVVPSISIQLQDEDETVRVNAVKLLGSLFASKYASYAMEFGRNFSEFLGRVNDQSVAVRQEVVEMCCKISDEKGQDINSYLEEPLTKSLRDPDSDIRLCALKRLLTIGLGRPLTLSVATYQEIGERVKDKKPDTRRVALTGLSKLYYQQLSSYLPTLSSLLAEEKFKDLSKLVNSDIMDRLGFVPSLLIKSWSYPEFSSKHMILQLLQEFILPKSSKSPVKESEKSLTSQEDDTAETDDSEGTHEICDVRATALLIMYGLLNTDDRTALGSILTFKNKVRSELKRFLDIRALLISAEQAKNTPAINGHTMNLRKSVGRLMLLVPTADKKSTCYDKIQTVKDKIVFRLLSDSVSAKDSITSALTHREDLMKRLDSKSATGEYFGVMYDIAGSLIVNSRMIVNLLKYMKRSSIHDRTKMSVELLTLLSKNNAQAFHGCADKISDWLNTCISFDAGRGKIGALRDEFLSSCISIIQNTSSAYVDDSHHTYLCSEIVNHVKSATSDDLSEKLADLVAQLALQSGDAATSRGSKSQSCIEVAVSLINHLSNDKNLSVNNSALHSHLSALSSLVKIPSVVYTNALFNSPHFITLMRTVKSIQSKVLDFINELLINNPPKKVGKRDIQNINAAFKVATSVLSTVEELRQLSPVMKVEGLVDAEEKNVTSSSSSNKKSSSSKKNSDSTTLTLNTLINILFSCIDGGKDVDERTIGSITIKDSSDLESLYDCASLCLINLVKLQKFHQLIGIEQWHSLGWTFLFATEEGKEKLLHALGSSMQTHPLHAKFLAFPCLLANSTDDAVVAAAEGYLIRVVQRLRCTHEELCSKIAATQNKDEASELRRLADVNIPESIVPYVLHLLCSHPEGVEKTNLTGENDSRKMKIIVKCIKMLLSVLQSSGKNEINNVSYILKQFRTFLCFSYYAKLLMEQVKTAESVQLYASDIILPPELFTLLDKKIGESKERKNMMEAAERAIDRELKLKTAAKRPLMSSPTAVKTEKRSPPAANEGAAAGAKKKSRKLQEEFDSDGENDDGNEEDEQNAKSKKRKSNSSAAAPAVEPTRAVPRRNAKAQVSSYAEPEENDRETDKWHEEAGKRRSKGSSGLVLSPIVADRSRLSDNIFMDLDDDTEEVIKPKAKATNKRAKA